ncbi:nucleoside phosphorylase [Candidatus Bipolaricaulota bacterium]|nr:nucleoside phosphorylase [Candidatus Bipolaricaulota bacterium]
MELATEKLPSILVAPGELPPYLLLPGDPARAARIAERLDSPQEIAVNREFHSYKGLFKGVPVGVLSTGIGAPSAAIACEEAIRAGARVLIRVGTAGALQEEIRDGDLVVALGAARGEGTTPRLFPLELPAVADPDVALALWRAAVAKGARVHRGTVVTLDLFYRGVLDLGLETYSRAGALAVEMECSAVFCVAALRGARAGAILAIDGSALKASAGEYDPHREVVKRAVELEIEIALEAVAALAKEGE